MNANSSNQNRLQISTRSAWRNLRINGYIANISDSPMSRNTSTKTSLSNYGERHLSNSLETVKQFTVVCRVFYPTPGNATERLVFERT